jgi:hypothetical protein
MEGTVPILVIRWVTENSMVAPAIHLAPRLGYHSFKEEAGLKWDLANHQFVRPALFSCL